MIDAIAFKFRTGTQRMHLPEKCGCRPSAFLRTGGQAKDPPAFTEVMARLCVLRRRERPRSGPGVVLADKACSSRAIP
jgi:hypothetical protein